ncbi:Chemotaxis protein CheW [Candidatus Arcanobacter lacustris]|jgi:purine-binding chemotaxis protein CheW|uniref:Chemotaxis protein CheW n=1 Tax=Candidatus Arcanibacter lacustris TaxID=1607817 RepID=A0A0F5MNH6_9RICK|nr:Chemotaxis protein CheW [Candidatus Arcanobacter lacustris]
MVNDLVLQNKNSLLGTDDEKKQFLTMELGGHLLGLSIYTVRDVLASQQITKIPLAPKEVLGSLNLRGRVVTAIDLKVVLNIEEEDKKDTVVKKKNMGVVVEHGNELYSFIVESVGEVLSLSASDFVTSPTNLSKNWRDLSLGICPLKGRLLIIIDITKVLKTISGANAG